MLGSCGFISDCPKAPAMETSLETEYDFIMSRIILLYSNEHVKIILAVSLVLLVVEN